MRLYSFTNMYLSPIQRGIQTAHGVGQLIGKYCVHAKGPRGAADTVAWATGERTIVVLDAGPQAELQEVEDFLYDNQKKHGLSWAAFREDKASLNGALTCVVVVVPDKIWQAAKWIRENPAPDPNSDNAVPYLKEYQRMMKKINAAQQEMIAFINAYPLA